MNDGRVLEEKIIERGPHYVITEKNGMTNKYFVGQISSIESEEDKNVLQAPAPVYEESKKDLKQRLIYLAIDTSGVRASLEKTAEQMITQAPAEDREKIRKLFNVDEIIDRIAPLYDKYYTIDDLKKIIRFYQSPTGRRVLEVTPHIMQDTVEVSKRYFKEKLKSP